MSKKVIAWAILSLQALVLSGCSFDYYFKDEDVVFRQRQLFNQLCEDPDRSIVYRTVRADGYLSASNESYSCQREEYTWEPLIKYGYIYHECTTGSVSRHHLPNNADFYRFTLEPEGSPLCSSGDKHYSYYSDDGVKQQLQFGGYYFVKKHKDKLIGKCLVVTKVHKPISRYMVLHTSIYIDEGQEYTLDEMVRKYRGNQNQKKGMITRIRDSVIDLGTGEILAQYSNYGFAPKNLTHAAGLGNGEGCQSGRIYLAPEKVLIP